MSHANWEVTPGSGRWEQLEGGGEGGGRGGGGGKGARGEGEGGRATTIQSTTCMWMFTSCTQTTDRRDQWLLVSLPKDTENVSSLYSSAW